MFFGGSPVLLPVEVQLAGGVEPETIATPVITPAPGCLTLPLIFDQPHMQYSSALSSRPIAEHQSLSPSLQQNNELSPNLSLAMGQSQGGEGKSTISQPLENSTMLSSESVTALHESFPFLRNYSSSACRGNSSLPLNACSTGFIPPSTTLSHLHTGAPLVSLLPPAPLLVPFPLIVPLPVPLPVPIPILPFPEPGSLSRASHTLKTSKSTQTMTEDITVCTHNRMSGYDFLQLPTQPPPPASQEEVLDLTVKVVPIRTKQEVQFSFSQDNILDLSVDNNSSIETDKDTRLKNQGRNEATKPILPAKCSQTQATGQSNGYSDVEFSMQYKWTTDERYKK